MATYCLRRVVYSIPVFFCVVTLIFFAMRAVPGGPAAALLGDHATADAIQKLEQKLGLDKPLHIQYWHFLNDLFRGKFGNSLYNNQPVIGQLVHALPYSAALCLGSIVVGLLLGVPMGLLSGVRRGRGIDHVIRVISLLGITMPVFYLGILLIVVFSVRLKLFPMIGGGDLSQPISFLRALVMPALALGVVMSAFVCRTVRSALLESLSMDYVTTARTKGLREVTVVVKHAFRNALVPTVAFLGVYVAVLLGGTVVVEVVFSRPGWGRILVSAMQQRDYPVLQIGLMGFSSVVVLINVLVDLCYAWIDPRIRY